MSCMYKIKEALPGLTATEKKIAEYILARPGLVLRSTAQELGAQSGTSSAAWIRFARRLDYKGLPAMKLDLAQDLVQESEEDDLYQAVIQEQESAAELVEKARRLNEKTINETFSLLNAEDLEKAIDLLRKAETIYLIGVGGSGIVCSDFLHKLGRIDRNAVYYEDTHMLLARIAHMKPEDVLVAVSYSGTTQMVCAAVRDAADKGVPVIALTRFSPRTPLAKNADICLYLPAEEGELRLGAIASRNASLILTDLLYLGVASENIEETKENLVESRNLVSQIR